MNRGQSPPSSRSSASAVSVLIPPTAGSRATGGHHRADRTAAKPTRSDAPSSRPSARKTPARGATASSRPRACPIEITPAHLMAAGQLPPGLNPRRPPRDRAQPSCQQQPSEPLGVLAIGLDPITATTRRLVRRDHLHIRQAAVVLPQDSLRAHHLRVLTPSTDHGSDRSASRPQGV